MPTDRPDPADDLPADLPPDVEPDGSMTTEPWVFEEAPRNALTPMGQVDSLGAFARGLGARRVKIAIGATALLALVLAFVNTTG